MQARWWLGPLVFLALLTAAGCRGAKDDPLFDQLAASEFGLGIRFDMISADVRAVIGEPTGRSERQGGLSKTEHYLAEGETALDSATPQLACSYINDKLMRLYNCYYPEDAARPLPPFFIEPLPGVKLGARKSDLVTALGSPQPDPESNEWRIRAADGRMIVVVADFVEVEQAGDALCCMLQVAFMPAAAEQRGEEYEKQKEAEDIIHGREKPDTTLPPTPPEGGI